MVSEALTIYMRRQGGKVEGDRLNFNIPGGIVSVTLNGCENDRAVVNSLNNAVYNLDMESEDFEHMLPIVKRSYDLVNIEEKIDGICRAGSFEERFGIIMNLPIDEAERYPEGVIGALKETADRLRDKGYTNTAEKIYSLFEEIGIRAENGVLYAETTEGKYRKLDGRHPFAENLTAIAIYEAPELSSTYRAEVQERNKPAEKDVSPTERINKEQELEIDR